MCGTNNIKTNAYRNIRICIFFFGLFEISYIVYKIYVFSDCANMKDEFSKVNPKEICRFLGRPMSIMMLYFEILEMVCLLMFVYGVWKGQWTLLLGWLALQITCIVTLIAFTVDTDSRLVPALLIVTNVLLWCSGIYVFIFLSRFDKESSFA